MAKDEQKHFDFPRASKLCALDRVVCSSPNVKALLRALDGECRDERTCTVTMKWIGVLMNVSAKTVQRAVKAAEAEGLLIVYGECDDGRANTYRVNWEAVFALPDGVSGGAVKSEVKRRLKGRNLERAPRTDCPGTPDNLTGDPGQIGGGDPGQLDRGVRTRR